MGKLLYGRVKALLFEMLSFERYWRERRPKQGGAIHRTQSPPCGIY